MQRCRDVTCAVAGLLLAASVTSCGGSDPAPHRLATSFRMHGDVRVFEKYDQRATGAVRSTPVRLQRGTRELSFRLDCVGVDGTLEVDVAGFGGAGSDCHASGGSRGLVVLGNGDTGPLRHTRNHGVTVTAPQGARWSVAIGASSKAS